MHITPNPCTIEAYFYQTLTFQTPKMLLHPCNALSLMTQYRNNIHMGTNSSSPSTDIPHSLHPCAIPAPPCLPGPDRLSGLTALASTSTLFDLFPISVSCTKPSSSSLFIRRPTPTYCFGWPLIGFVVEDLLPSRKVAELTEPVARARRSGQKAGTEAETMPMWTSMLVQMQVGT